MKIKKHLDVIKNFSEISPQMVFTSGKIKIINQSDSIFANYEWGETIPTEKFGIHNVKEFTQIVSLFDDPDINVTDKQIILEGNNRKSPYAITDPSLIKWSDKEVKEEKLGQSNIKFRLDKDLWKEINNCISVIQAKHLTFNVKDEKLIILLTDVEASSSNKYEIAIANDKFEGTLSKEMVMYADDFKIIEGNYEVYLYEDKIFRFVEPERKINYFISPKK